MSEVTINVTGLGSVDNLVDAIKELTAALRADQGVIQVATPAAATPPAVASPPAEPEKAAEKAPKKTASKKTAAAKDKAEKKEAAPAEPEKPKEPVNAPADPEDADDETFTDGDLRAALTALQDAIAKAATTPAERDGAKDKVKNEVMLKIGGSAKLSGIEPAKYGAVIKACKAKIAALSKEGNE